MGKNIGAGLVGVVIAGLLVWLVEMIGHQIFTVPEGLDYTNREAMTAYIESLPAAALLFPVAGWIIGTFAGTLAACRIGTAPPYIFAGLVGGLILLGITINVMAFPHPTWMAVAGVVGTFAAAWLGQRIGGAKASAE